ncbi:MAG: DUF5009 domain-containing protein [Cyclobacteriaceae bacterium]
MTNHPAEAPLAAAPPRYAPGQRYLALDVLRGMTIALMIVVNTPGSWETIYGPFRHAAWHGFTPTDLVFPSFLFVVGNAMSFSMQKFEQLGQASFLKKVFTRTALIFLIGLFLNAFPFVVREGQDFALIDFSGLRIMGVLQRIALCYLAASLIVYYFRVKGAAIFTAVLLLAYWAIAYYYGDAGTPYSLEGNAAGKFDRLVFDAKNLYQGFGLPFDPEGLLSTLPAIGNVLVGYLAGLFIRKRSNTMYAVKRLLIAGGIFMLSGALWSFSFPINKPIWTSSYVVYSSGLLLALLAALVYTVEIKQWKGWTRFFEAFGKNPLFIYILAWALISLLGIIYIEGMGANTWLYKNAFLSWLDGKNASLLFAVCYMLLMWLVGYIMNRKGIYVKV